MIRSLLILALILLPLFVFAGEYETLRDELLAGFSIDEVNNHTCRRVGELGRDTVTEQECRARVEEANRYCRALAPEYIPDTPSQEDIQTLGAIAMICPIARVLKISFRIEDGRAFVGWNELLPAE